jgi:hypothetical protein
MIVKQLFYYQIMNTKWTLLVVLVVVFSSCKRELVSVKTNSPDKESFSFNTISENSVGQMASGMSSESADNIAANSIQQNQMEKKLSSKKIILKEESPSETKIDLKTKKEIKRDRRQKKEKDPRLTTALIMTIFGGIATTLGIVLYAYAPTGLFIFVFGIIFIVGLISLFMYLANPKPKM